MKQAPARRRRPWLGRILALVVVALEVCHLFLADRYLPITVDGNLLLSAYLSSVVSEDAEKPDGFDTAAPPVVRGVTHLLPSIPAKHRIPNGALRNTTRFFQDWTAGASPDALFVYNPSIIALPGSSLAKLILKQDKQGRPPVYLASFRLSSVHSCGFTTYAFWDHPRNLFGFALLDARLELIPGYDVVIDLNGYFGRRVKFEDLRLFEIGGEIYMSSYEKLVPIDISLPEKGSTKSKRLPNLFGDGLEVSVLGNAISIDCKGKNFQYFTSGMGSAENGKKGKVLMEAWPAQPRVVLELDLKSPNTKTNRYGTKAIPTISEHKSGHLPDVNSTLNASLTKTFMKRDRGTACCVRIDNAHFKDLVSNEAIRSHDYVLVGVAHTKSRGRMPSSQGDRFNYLSRLYAFSPHVPYALLARSGLMCFDFPRGKEAKADPYAELTQAKKLELHDQQFDCPNVHFVSSIIEKAGDESKMIVGYGVNDCVARMVEINKRDFAERLFTTR